MSNDEKILSLVKIILDDAASEGAEALSEAADQVRAMVGEYLAEKAAA